MVSTLFNRCDFGGRYSRLTSLLLFFIALFFFSGMVRAQDTIYKLDGVQILAKVQEVGEDSVSYLKEKKLLLLNKKQIVKIRYENGFEEAFSGNAGLVSSVPQISQRKELLPYDVLFTTDGRQLKVKVLEVDESNVTYSSIGSTGVDKIKISAVEGIRYANGFEEAYNASAAVKQAAIVSQAGSGTVAPVSGNDVIKFRDGREIKGRVIEVDEATLKYSLLDTAEEKQENVPLYTLLKITYANGFEEVYSGYKNTDADKDAALALNDATEVNPEAKKGSLKEDNTKPVKGNKEKKKGEIEEAVVSRPAISGKVYTADDYSKMERFYSVSTALVATKPVQVLDLTGLRLKELPEEVRQFKDLLFINLSGCPLKKFPVELFDLPELRYVNLDNANIQSISLDKKLIEKLKKSKITFISLNTNKFTRIPTALLYLNDLTELEMNSNQISDLSFDKSYNPAISNLRTLELKSNRFTEIPEELGKLASLEKLILSENNLKSVEKADGFSRLKVLDLSGNPLTALSDKIYGISSLEELKLGQTVIETLPDSVFKLSKLKSIVLPGTFNLFPKDFGQLIALDELYISHLKEEYAYKRVKSRPLSTFPKEILDCYRLKTLVISGFELREIPKEIAKLRNLEFLYLNNCSLVDLPNELFNIPNLKILDLSGNVINHVDVSVGQLSHLKVLNLTNSPVSGKSLLNLRKVLPQAQLNYYDTNFGLNFESKALPYSLRPQFKNLFVACDRNDADAFYELGSFFEQNGDFGLAEKAFRAIVNNPELTGRGKSVICLLKIAEIYDDITGAKSYQSPYKRKTYTDYADYSTTSNNNKAYTIYMEISNINTLDDIARQAQKKANARINVICNEMADNLQKIFEYNNSEIERLIGGSGNMQNLAAAGTKIMSDSQLSNSSGGALLGAAFSIFGQVSSSVKDSKADRLKNDNARLKEEITGLRLRASNYMSK